MMEFPNKIQREILRKIEEKEFEEKAIKHGLCPYCGHEMQDVGPEHLVILRCHRPEHSKEWIT